MRLLTMVLGSWAVPVLWLSSVLLGAGLLRALVRRVARLARARDPQQATTHLLLERISTGFLWVFAAGLCAYAFLDESYYALFGENLLRVVWFFVVTFSAVAAAAAARVGIERAEARDDTDATTYRFMRYVAVFSIYGLGVILVAMAIPGLQTVAQSALAGAGMLAVVAGVASQEALANLVGGVMIVIFRPFKLGDSVRVGPELLGAVEDITLRHTVIRNRQNQRFVVPNAVINKEVVVNFNLTDQRNLTWVEVGVAYHTDLREAKRIIRHTCEAHASCIDNRSPEAVTAGAPIVDVRVIALSASSIDLRAWVWAPSHDAGFEMKCDLLHALRDALKAAEIEIPFPQRSVTMRKEGK